MADHFFFCTRQNFVIISNIIHLFLSNCPGNTHFTFKMISDFLNNTVQRPNINFVESLKNWYKLNMKN